MYQSKLTKILLLVVFLIFLVSSLNGLVFAKEYTFYIVTHGSPTDPYWARVIMGMENAADLLTKGTEDTVNATYVAPDSYSISKFIDAISSVVTMNPDGLIVSLPSPQGEDEVLRDAVKRGIPLIAIDMPDPRPSNERIPYLFCTTAAASMYDYGAGGAKKMLTVCDNPTRAVVLIHEPGNVGLEQQTQGFLDVMAAAGVPGDKLLTGQDATQGVEIVRSYFAKHPETDVLFTMGPKANLQAITYLKESGKAGKIDVGFKDIDELTLSAISEGIAHFTMTSQQYYKGYLSIILMYLYKTYGLIPTVDVLATGANFVDKTNLEEVRKFVEQRIW